MKHAIKSEFECTALLLQGGGALGAYQGGVYEALHEAKVTPNWVAGISIGAFNAAIIAGNAPEKRLEKLRQFWETVTTDNLAYYPDSFQQLLTQDTQEHQWLNAASALHVLTAGIPGFFHPRLLPPWLAMEGKPQAISFYDSAPLRSTLEKVVDFDRINSKEMLFTSGAVNVTSGNFITFSNDKDTITPAHIMASGALPPGLPPVEIDGEYYWDGGVISNTPLGWLLKSEVYRDSLVFQVDLWSADGEFPQNIVEALTREKDIRYSSRTRASTDRFRERRKIRHAIAELLEHLPDNLKKLPGYKILKAHSDHKAYNIVHLIYHNKSYEGYAKDFEFSRLSMEAHWKAGYSDTMRTLEKPEIFKLPKNAEGIAVYDFSRDGKKIEKVPERKQKRA